MLSSTHCMWSKGARSLLCLNICMVSPLVCSRPTRTQTHTYTHQLCPVLPPVLYLCPSCPPHSARKCKLERGLCPRRPIYHGWQKTQWPQVTEENGRAERCSFLIAAPAVVHPIFNCLCRNTQQCYNLYPSFYGACSEDLFQIYLLLV